MSAVQLREEISAKSKQLHAITSALGKDNNVAAAAAAAGMAAETTAAALSAAVQARVAELNGLNEQFKPYRELEAAATLASEYERTFNAPAPRDITMPGEKPKADGKIRDLGQAFIQSRAYRAYRERGSLEVSDVVPVDLRATLFQTSAGWAVESPAPSQVSTMPKEPTEGILARIPMIRWNQALYTFMEETTHTDNAVEKAEGAAFGEAAFVMTKREKTVRKIPNSLPVTDEQLADVEGAEDFVRGRVEFQLKGRLAKQCLAGDGVAPNIEGTEAVTGIQSVALGVDTLEDAIFKMLQDIRGDGFAEPDVIFLTPTQWETIRLRKDANGNYFYGPPSGTGPDTLWGLPVVQTARHTSTKVIAGAYRAYSLLAVKQDVEFAIGYTGSQFTEGEKTIRADIRAAMVHLRPKAFGVVTGA